MKPKKTTTDGTQIEEPLMEDHAAGEMTATFSTAFDEGIACELASEP